MRSPIDDLLEEIQDETRLTQDLAVLDKLGEGETRSRRVLGVAFVSLAGGPGT
jgi:hypothetical protein